MYDNFWKGNTALAGFRDSVIAEYKRNGGKYGGYIRGLDGRKLFGRSEHSLVNLKFQSDGALLVKTAMCFLFNAWIPREGIEAYLILQQHDEFEARVRPDHTERYKELALLSFIKAGEYWNYNVPILGDAKVGKTWKDVH